MSLLLISIVSDNEAIDMVITLKTKARYALAIAFCAYICVTAVISMVYALLPVGGKVYHGIMERQSLKTIISSAEDAYKSSICQKSSIAKIDAILTYLMTKSIRSVQVLQGKEGWLFYKSETDGDPIADYQGTNTFTEEEMKAALRAVVQVDDYLEEKEISFVLLVAPNKETIYSEYMPDEIEKVSQKSRTDLLIEYLQQNSDVNIVYLKDALLENKTKDSLLYYKFDTHWNQLGGFVGVQQIMASWGFQTEELSQKTILQEPLQYHLSAMDDLAKMAGIRELCEENEYIIEGTETIDWETIEEQGNGYIHLINNNATHQERILLIGDSFRVAMIPELSSAFRDVYIVAGNEYKPEMIDDISPDRVIMEYVERYSNTITGASI